MKKIFTIVCLLISLSLSASHDHLSLTGVTSGSHFYYCTTVDSVIVDKPTSAGTIFTWYHPGLGYSSADTIIITSATQGYWYFDDGNMIQFYVNFVSISPTVSWTATDTSKCTESSLVLKGQVTNQPDFTYTWSTGSQASQISVNTPGMYKVTTVGACATVSDSITVHNYPIPVPNLGPDVDTCDGNTVTLNPGSFNSYAWSTSVSTPTINVMTADTYRVTVTDINGCHASDTIVVSFIINYGEQIYLVTIDTLNGNNKVLWETDQPYVATNIYRGSALVGSTNYADGHWTDSINSVSQTWTYRITTVDVCNNESPKSLYHTTISTATVPLIPDGYRIEWTPYLIEGGAKSVSKYHIFSTEGFGLYWILYEFAIVDSNVLQYNLPSVTDSMFVIGAEVTTGAKSFNLSLSNVVDNPLFSSVPSLVAAQRISIYPNPSNGNVTVSGEGDMSIYNEIGDCISTRTICGTTHLDLPTGIYIVKITEKNNIITQKVIIQ